MPANANQYLPQTFCNMRKIRPCLFKPLRVGFFLLLFATECTPNTSFKHFPISRPHKTIQWDLRNHISLFFFRYKHIGCCAILSGEATLLMQFCEAWFAHFSLSGINSTYFCQPLTIKNVANSSPLPGPGTHLDPV